MAIMYMFFCLFDDAKLRTFPSHPFTFSLFHLFTFFCCGAYTNFATKMTFLAITVANL
jgi:hypothetical protein